MRPLASAIRAWLPAILVVGSLSHPQPAQGAEPLVELVLADYDCDGHPDL